MLNHNFWKEIYKKERINQNVYTEFRPNLKVSPITGKFYARHENNLNLNENNMIKNEDLKDHYMKLLEKFKTLGPANKYPSPQTENQIYGWHNKPFIPREEYKLFFPHIEAPEIKLDIILKQNYKNDVPFTGIPFK